MCVRRLGFFNAVNRLDHIRDQHIFFYLKENIWIFIFIWGSLLWYSRIYYVLNSEISKSKLNSLADAILKPY